MTKELSLQINLINICYYIFNYCSSIQIAIWIHSLLDGPGTIESWQIYHCGNVFSTPERQSFSAFPCSSIKNVLPYIETWAKNAKVKLSYKYQNLQRKQEYLCKTYFYKPYNDVCFFGLKNLEKETGLRHTRTFRAVKHRIEKRFLHRFYCICEAL